MKTYYIRYPRNFANEYDLVWIASTDTVSIAKALEKGYERITRAQAYDKISQEKWRRSNDQMMSGYAPTEILPFQIEGIGEDERTHFFREDKESGILCGDYKQIRLYSTDGIVFFRDQNN